MKVRWHVLKWPILTLSVQGKLWISSLKSFLTSNTKWKYLSRLSYPSRRLPDPILPSILRHSWPCRCTWQRLPSSGRRRWSWCRWGRRSVGRWRAVGVRLEASRKFLIFGLKGAISGFFNLFKVISNKNFTIVMIRWGSNSQPHVFSRNR